MTDALRTHLEEEVLATTFSDLAPHFARGALLVARGDLDLVEAAIALAQDDVTRVEAWLADGALTRPTDAQASAWAEASPRFQFLIVQPWVLAQELPSLSVGLGDPGGQEQ